MAPTQIVLLITGLKPDSMTQLKKCASVLHAQSVEVFSQKGKKMILCCFRYWSLIVENNEPHDILWYYFIY